MSFGWLNGMQACPVNIFMHTKAAPFVVAYRLQKNPSKKVTQLVVQMRKLATMGQVFAQQVEREASSMANLNPEIARSMVPAPPILNNPPNYQSTGDFWSSPYCTERQDPFWLHQHNRIHHTHGRPLSNPITTIHSDLCCGNTIITTNKKNVTTTATRDHPFGKVVHWRARYGSNRTFDASVITLDSNLHLHYKPLVTLVISLQRSHKNKCKLLQEQQSLTIVVR